MEKSEFTSQLLKEAESRVSAQPSVAEPCSNPQVVEALTIEAEQRIAKLKSIKEASIEKQAFSYGTARKDHNNSTLNVEWKMPDLTQRMAQIKAEMEEQYAPYMFREINRKKTKLPPSLVRMPEPSSNIMTISSEHSEVVGEPEASLVMRFRYQRKIRPLEKQDQTAYEKTQQAEQSIERHLPGFGAFLNAIESNDMGLNPYFHTSVFDEKRGGAIPGSVLNSFVQRESERDSQFYRQHLQRLQSDSRGTPLRLAIQGKSDRVYKNSDVDEIFHPNYLVRALADKVRAGYVLNVGMSRPTDPSNTSASPGLLQDLEAKKQQWKQRMGLNGNNLSREQRDYVSALDQHYNEMGRNIIRNFREGCVWRGGTPPKGAHPWGTRATKTGPQYQPGLLVQDKGYVHEQKDVGEGSEIAKSKHVRCASLTMEELRLAIKHCTQYIGDGQPIIGPDEFFIEKMSQTHMPNGLDSSPMVNGGTMLTMPALRRAPNVYVLDSEGNRIRETDARRQAETGSEFKVKRSGDVFYDRDNCNGGRIHCVKNFYGPQGGFKSLLTTFGPQAEMWLNSLNDRNVLRSLSKEAQWAWQASVGSSRSAHGKQRTGAETVADMLRKYPDWETFNRGILSRSTPQELAAYHRAASSPMGHPLRALRDKYDNGQITWDQFGDELVRGGLIRLETATEAKTRMRPEDFELYKRYAYPLAKIMDFAYAVMTSCCKEEITTRVVGKRNSREPYQEYLYGRKYSASSGVGSGGQIMLGLKYAYSAPEIAEDPNLVAAVKRERSKRTSIERPKGTTERRTQWPQTMQGDPGQALVPEKMTTPDAEEERMRYEGDPVVMRVVESLNYYIGEAGSQEGMLKRVAESSDWYTLVDEFQRRFPELEQQVGVLIGPINARLSRIANNQKKSIDAVRQKIEALYRQAGANISLEVLYESANGRTELLTPSSINLEEQMNQMQQKQDDRRATENQAAISQPAAAVPETNPSVGQDIQTVEMADEIPEEVPEFTQQPAPPPVAPMGPTPVPYKVPAGPEGQTMDPNAMPGSPQGARITRRNRDRNLLRDTNAATVVRRMQKIADELDRRGLGDLADKFDRIIRYLTQRA